MSRALVLCLAASLSFAWLARPAGAAEYGSLWPSPAASYASSPGDVLVPGTAAVCTSCSDCQGQPSVLNTCGLRMEYLMWWTRGRNVPPLVTTSPPGTDREEAGVLGFPDTEILYGDNPIGEQLRSGLRLTYNHLLADGCTFLDVRAWGLEDGSETFFAASAGDPILAIPFFNVTLDAEDALLIAFPGVTSDGSVRVLSKNDVFGFDASLRRTWCSDRCYQVDLLAGYQFSRIDDYLEIRSLTASVDPQGASPVGTIFDVRDTFLTKNEFHGGHIGFWAEWRRSCYTLDVLGKVAIGDMRQEIAIRGTTVIDDPLDGESISDRGLFARTTNNGNFERHRFAVVPEININLGYEFCPCWRATIGYTFIYWSNVALTGNQIDRAADLSNNPEPDRPRFAFSRSDFWAQGLSLGVEHRW